MIRNLRINLKSDSQFFSEDLKMANNFLFLKSSSGHSVSISYYILPKFQTLKQLLC